MPARLPSWALAIILVSSFVATAGAAGTAQQALLDADGARVAALLASDAGALGRLFSDEMTYVHTSGVVDGKSQLLGKLKSGELIFESIKTQDVVARPYGAAGVVTGTAELHVQNAHRPLTLLLRYTATYIHRDGRWQLVAYQSTQLPPG
jgi:hypothetical protein